ncbi:MAG: HAMP domain-containing histidine kinase [Candidatus Pacebacteria bacterium]|nr:HAMP domain-containing histidine kinase [Candidatus Paceibacterota bacterium]
MNTLFDFSLTCSDALPTLFGVLDPSIAPAFMYYSYVPIIIISLLFALFIFFASKKTLASKILLWATVLFAVSLSSEILLWISAPVHLIHFIWGNLSVLHILFVYLLGYFTYTFIAEKDLSLRAKWIWAALALPPILLTPSPLNLSAFDMTNCESLQGILWFYIYGLDTLVGASLLYFGVKFSRSCVSASQKRKSLLLSLATALCLLIYVSSYAIGDATLIYDINLLGPIGMVLFLGSLTYLIVAYRAFNVKVISAQALIVAVITAVFSALFVRTIENVRYVLFGTLVLVFILGYWLIKGVQREIKQREEIEKLAQNLEFSNKQQVILIHFITHQIKGFVAKSRNIFSLLLDGDYGQLPDSMRPLIEEGFRSDTKGANTIQEILSAANIKSGKVTYSKAEFDVKALTEEIAGDLKPLAETKGLTLELSLGAEPVMIHGDRIQLLQAIKNLIDNSIKYTPKGTVAVALTKADKLVRFTVKDTGVGITKEDMAKLFTEGGHGTNSQKINVDSTGFGLYIVKNIIEAHGGHVFAESEGEGKGSTFTIELPI